MCGATARARRALEVSTVGLGSQFVQMLLNYTLSPYGWRIVAASLPLCSRSMNVSTGVDIRQPQEGSGANGSHGDPTSCPPPAHSFAARPAGPLSSLQL
jgi:hypothetical protein